MVAVPTVSGCSRHAFGSAPERLRQPLQWGPLRQGLACLAGRGSENDA